MRILFFSEAVTTAQVVRLAKLARGLDGSNHELHFTACTFDDAVFRDLDVTRWRVRSLEAERVLSQVERGAIPYTRKVLEEYVREDLAVIEKAQPDLVIGDFRLSLAISAPVAGVPLWTLINAYWSPHAVRARFPLPDHPIIRWVGVERAQQAFPLVLPKILERAASAANAVRRAHSLPKLKDLLELLTFGDATLYPDVPELVPMERLPSHHHFIGPILWSYPTELPFGVELGRSRPLVYVTMGSSGAIGALRAVVEGAAELDADVLVATAGRAADVPSRPNLTVVPFVPGDDVCRRASLVISNGGSTTGYQALAAGCPVLGVTANLDQSLAMSSIEAFGAGRSLRRSAATPEAVRRMVAEMLVDASLRTRAAEAKRALHSLDPRQQVARLLTKAVERE